MNKIKLLVVIVIGLCLVNIGLMAFILSQPPGPPSGMPGPPGMHPEERPRRLIIEKLDLDKQQVTAYDQLIESHRGAVRNIEDSMRTTKNQLYATLNQSNAALKDSLVARLASLQQQIEMVHYSHFEDIRKLCRPDQLKLFQELTADLAAYFRPGKRK